MVLAMGGLPCENCKVLMKELAQARSEAVEEAANIPKNFKGHETAHKKRDAAGFGKCGLCEIESQIRSLNDRKEDKV